MDERKERLEFLENRLEMILRAIAETSFRVNSSDFDFYNETNYHANKLRELASDLQETNDEICDILDWYFDMTFTYPETKYYGDSRAIKPYYYPNQK